MNYSSVDVTGIKALAGKRNADKVEVTIQIRHPEYLEEEGVETLIIPIMNAIKGLIR